MKLQKYSMPTQIAKDIEQQIKEGKLSIGDKMPTEPELVKEYGASRNTVREAVQALIQAGILESKQGNGTYVVANDRLQVDLFSLMNEVTQDNIIEVRSLLEKYIVQSAILHQTAHDITIIEECLSIRNNMLEQSKEYTKADIDFHIAIANATHNLLLIKIYEYVAQFFAQFINLTAQSHLQECQYVDQLHSNLFVAIKNKDIASAKKAIQEIIDL